MASLTYLRTMQHASQTAQRLFLQCLTILLSNSTSSTSYTALTQCGRRYFQNGIGGSTTIILQQRESGIILLRRLSTLVRRTLLSCTLDLSLSLPFLSLAIPSHFPLKILFNGLLDHCIDSIRQSIMCHGDIATVYWQWMPVRQQPLPRLEITHTCRDFDAITDWAKEHRLKMDEVMLQWRPGPEESFLLSG